MASLSSILCLSGPYRWLCGVRSDVEDNMLWVDTQASIRRNIFFLIFIFILSYIPLRIYDFNDGWNRIAWPLLGAIFSVIVFALTVMDYKRPLSKGVLSCFIWMFFYCDVDVLDYKVDAFTRLRFLAPEVFLVFYWSIKFLEVILEDWKKPYFIVYQYKNVGDGEYEESGKIFVQATGQESLDTIYYCLSKNDKVINVKDLYGIDYLTEYQYINMPTNGNYVDPLDSRNYLTRCIENNRFEKIHYGRFS